MFSLYTMKSFYDFTFILVLAAQASAQCYYAAGKLASDNYVPCGSTSSGQVQSCCHLGDNCLANGVCFSSSTFMTYIAGCTDSEYSDGACGAQQCGKNTQIQGIAMPCSQGTWQCCSGAGQRADNPSRTSPSSCECDDNSVEIFQGQTGFALTAVLPQSRNGQIALVNSGGSTTGLIPVPTASSSDTPTPTPSSSPTTTPSESPTESSASSSPPNTDTNTSPTNTSPSSSPTSSSSPATGGNGNGESSSNPNLKLILGITIPIVIIVLAGLGFMGFRFYRRRQASRDEFGGGGWDPFRHQPDERRGSRSSAVWDSSYNAAGIPAQNTADTDDVAEAVRRNAEAHRKHYRSDSGGLRPMSEMGGFVPWKTAS